MYRYDLLFSNAKTGASNWIVGFVSLQAARAYADQLRNARQDDNIVCALYARTEEGNFHRYTGDDFRAEPVPEGVKYRYLVVSEDGSVGQAFDDRQGAEDFIDSHPGLLLRLRAQRADGFAAPSPNAAPARAQAGSAGAKAGPGAPGPAGQGNGAAAGPGPSQGSERGRAEQGRPGGSQGPKRTGQRRGGRSWVAPALAGAAGAGIGAFAANAAFANNASEGVSADPLAAEGLSGEGMAFGEGAPFAGEGFSGAGLGEGAFAGEGFSGAGLGEGAFAGEGLSSTGLGAGGAFTGEGLSGAGLGEGSAFAGVPCDDGSMAAGMAPGEDIFADTEMLADADAADLGEGFAAEDIAGDDEDGLLGSLASLFGD